MSTPSSPHDAVFRRILGEPANAASQLRAVLPASLVKQLDLDQLTPVPGSLVDADLRWRHTDLLFTAPMRDRQAFIYVLVEHQSSADPLMPFRIMRYLVRIWDRWLAEHPKAQQLPVVIPLVVHHDRQPWSGPTQLRDLLDLEPGSVEGVEEYLPQLRFLLDDLAGLDVQALRVRPVSPPVRVTLLLLKIANGNARLAEDLRPWVDDLRAILHQPGGLDQFRAMMTYIELVGEAPADELEDLVTQLGSEAEEAYVTTAEMLRAEGEARGRAEGEALGRAEGEALGRAEGEALGLTKALVRLLTIKFGPLPQDALDTVQAASTDQLETWTTRVLTADTLDELLR